MKKRKSFKSFDMKYYFLTAVKIALRYKYKLQTKKNI